ncbi:bactofilin family protein [Methylacidimicrobium cyclopophantes]|uniref:bactofilin family protein n=1 Tax=Methylacidimicrobium cyclopophantes TaxID=1041766 RepID=UPI0015B53838|nr:polymer-forming cytoskeletal protein [Methylacidimicrobium cyclopophantes]
MSVIAAGTQLRGALAFSGVLVVNGRFLGELSSPEGTALVGAKGEVQAQIDAAELRVEGKVKGNIFARGSLELRAGADVQGTIRCVRLLIEEEAYFQGHCECVRPPRQEPEGAPNRPDMYAFFAAARVALAWR